jgi:hypothetical protein
MRKVFVPVVRELMAARRHVTAEAASGTRERLVPEPVERS